MPIYEYVCSDCGLKFEMLRRLSEATERADCPQCHKSVERVMSIYASFAKDESGLTSRIAGSGSSCATCGAASCDSCGL